ncbi:MAG: tRNA dihydrouridine synthase DusB, partial [candidate division KSB1 bacterium]|nr:tRNA dihydrouridine synthase DusB [candidate division KSB1 bacterium]
MALAPLAGWSDSPFRQLCREFGADLVYSEMISADGVGRNQAKTLKLAEFVESERPIGLQVFGAEPETVAEAARILAQLKPDFIDLNFGCPAKKVVRRGAGSALLSDLPLLQKIAAAAVRAVDLPVTAKLRSGWDAASINVVEAARRLADVGIVALTVHPLTQTMQFSGKADWEIIRRVVEAVSIPVIGNGDVKSPADAQRMFKTTGCRGVMIGRAASANPWIFRQISQYLA